MTGREQQPPTSRTELWNSAVRDASGGTFATVVAANVRLEGTAFTSPIHGVEDVWAVLRASAGIFEELRFTREAEAGERSYLEWDGTLLHEAIAGVTVIETDTGGRISHVAIYHRPLTAALNFSAELGRRLANSALDPKCFFTQPWKPDPTATLQSTWP
jgi:hypothetical protein